MSVTCDAWMSPLQIPFLGITVHWINENFQMQSRVLDLICLRGPHTGENLAKALVDVLRTYKLMDKASIFHLFICFIRF